MYLQLGQIKKHLNIDGYFQEDDDYLISLAEVAEKVIEKHIDRNLSEIVEVDGELPSPLLHAMLLFIGNMYQSRESISFSNAIELPLSYSYLLSLYKNYSNENNSL